MEYRFLNCLAVKLNFTPFRPARSRCQPNLESRNLRRTLEWFFGFKLFLTKRETRALNLTLIQFIRVLYARCPPSKLLLLSALQLLLQKGDSRPVDRTARRIAGPLWDVRQSPHDDAAVLTALSPAATVIFAAAVAAPDMRDGEELTAKPNRTEANELDCTKRENRWEEEFIRPVCWC